MLKMAEAETLGPNIADEGGVEKDQRQRGNPSEVTDSNEDQTKDALADQRDAVEENNQPKGRVDDSVNDANKEGEKTHLHLCEQCETGTKKVDLCGDNEDSEQHNQADIVRTAGSGCSSPASSTAGVDHDLRLPVGSPGAWPPGGYPVHYVADSPLTPTRFRSKSEADTSTNPVHAQPVVGGASSVRPKERRAHSTSSAVSPNSTSSSSTAESPRGEPAGSASGSLSLHGTVTRQGEMLSFVADDLMEKIRQSGDPLKAKDRGSSTGSSACHTPSSSHSRTPSLSPSGISASAIPPVDPTALADIEKHSKRVADSVELMMGHLSSTLQNMSAITVGHTQTYRDAVDKAGVTVDQSVKCMYALIARCEELNKTMEPVHRLANQIKSIKRLLEEMESVCK
ncbi:BLOC-1-related complex subunit 6-like isoform X1 [Acanthaster planci]|uniref:BLOC-1-related complex subunit 6-like isoform X1 n=1 Tax=Acanthaster planci TaxID=133434 RepID=A0A8B7XLZ7_ACAPL|nr:BLOC-1-related complex subunit 6-like isoform X1 [Acanthaster planci]XP_022081130.1 BLOC-1-related complex subunit 6-like isoform X1 [Acanthaster planci]XP_022081131.1 BLOC-1-related complex subunit 6-like isoform X1 [Acanthaster planci]